MLLLIVGGPHSENHCPIHQDFQKNWYSKKMLHAGPVGSWHLFLHRLLQGSSTGPVWEMHEFHGCERPLEGWVADALCILRALGEGRWNELVQAVEGIWLKGSLEWTRYIS